MDLSDTIANSRLQAIADGLDADASPAELRFYEGPVPAAPGDPLTGQTLLATAVFGQPSGVVADRELTLALPAEVMADAAGTIGWARAVDGAEAWAADLTVGQGDPTQPWAPGDPDILLDALDVQAGGLIRILAAIIGE